MWETLVKNCSLYKTFVFYIKREYKCQQRRQKKARTFDHLESREFQGLKTLTEGKAVIYKLFRVAGRHHLA
jgi:hypothetical protein